MVRKFLLIVLMVCLIVAGGCMQPAARPPVTTTLTPVPVTLLPEAPAVPVSVPQPPVGTPAPILVVNETPAPTPDPADVSRIRFTRYSDPDFSLDYPSGWTISTSTYTSHPCTMTSSVPCYQTEVKVTGPFDFNDYSYLNKPARIVTFTSADRRQKLVAFTSDFTADQTGNLAPDPDLARAKNLVTQDYPDVPGSAIGDYRYARTANTLTSTYILVLPEGTAAYPLAYTMKNYVTFHHVYAFAYISDIRNFRTYHDLNDHILASIIPADNP
jgi:hypothetical protein